MCNNEQDCILNPCPSPGHPTDQGRLTGHPTPVPLTCCWVCPLVSPLSWATPLHSHWITLWAWGSSQSSQAKVTSSDSHSEVSYSPGAEVEYLNLSELQEGTSFQCSNSTIKISTDFMSCRWHIIKCFLIKKVHDLSKMEASFKIISFWAKGCATVQTNCHSSIFASRP